MHRKFRHGSGGGSSGCGDVFKGLAAGRGGGGGGGGSCNCLSGRSSAEEYRHHLGYGHRHRRPSNALLCIAEDDFYGGGGVSAAEELFGGLLAIGTLGIGPEPIDEGAEYEVDDPFAGTGAETPRFGPPVATAATAAAAAGGMDLVEVSPELEKVLAAEAAAATESELMVVSAELEKVLAAEIAEKGGSGGDAAGRRVSSARTSGAASCPLQGFLFGSPIEVAETAAAEGARRERRASLGELFMRSRISEGGGGGGWKDEEAGDAARAAEAAEGCN
uniref:Uncharacterized protein n=1 Tax=Ananas comosus var. bracteatus TaxID=296719 RepID=A0A6V7NNT2_ANACO|nr:unnamed protein product [Ananas comosus var. bracteatus]